MIRPTKFLSAAPPPEEARHPHDQCVRVRFANDLFSFPFERAVKRKRRGRSLFNDWVRPPPINQEGLGEKQSGIGGLGQGRHVSRAVDQGLTSGFRVSGASLDVDRRCAMDDPAALDPAGPLHDLVQVAHIKHRLGRSAHLKGAIDETLLGERQAKHAAAASHKHGDCH